MRRLFLETKHPVEQQVSKYPYKQYNSCPQQVSSHTNNTIHAHSFSSSAMKQLLIHCYSKAPTHLKKNKQNSSSDTNYMQPRMCFDFSRIHKAITQMRPKERWWWILTTPTKGSKYYNLELVISTWNPFTTQNLGWYHYTVRSIPGNIQRESLKRVDQVYRQHEDESNMADERWQCSFVVPRLETLHCPHLMAVVNTTAPLLSRASVGWNLLTAVRRGDEVGGGWRWTGTLLLPVLNGLCQQR